MPIGSVTAEALESFCLKLRRCRDHCDWVSVNPTARARKPAPPAPDPQPPTPDEAAALVTECWAWDLGPFAWLAMTTGARRGELCALRWRDLQVRHTTTGEHDCVEQRCHW